MEIVTWITHLLFKFSIGIIGKSFADFDLIRLILKPHVENHVIIPSEYLLKLPN